MIRGMLDSVLKTPPLTLAYLDWDLCGAAAAAAVAAVVRPHCPPPLPLLQDPNTPGHTAHPPSHCCRTQKSHPATLPAFPPIAAGPQHTRPHCPYVPSAHCPHERSALQPTANPAVYSVVRRQHHSYHVWYCSPVVLHLMVAVFLGSSGI